MTAMHTEIRQFIADTFLPRQANKTVGDQVSLQESGVMDSSGILELVAFLEERYGIAVDDHDMVPANLDSVSQLASFVSRKLQAQGRLSA